jgi:hypothetical protein
VSRRGWSFSSQANASFWHFYGEYARLYLHGSYKRGRSFREQTLKSLLFILNSSPGISLEPSML